MDDHDDKPRHLFLLLLAAIGLTAILLWISNLTAGPEHGGRYDVPAINSAAWFAFMIAAAGAFILAMLGLARLGERVASRRRSGSVPGE